MRMQRLLVLCMAVGAMCWLGTRAGLAEEARRSVSPATLSGSLPRAAQQMQAYTAQHGNPVSAFFRTLTTSVSPVRSSAADSPDFDPDARAEPITLHDYLNPSVASAEPEALVELDVGF